MSMLSSKCDELRKLADKLESYDQGYGKICRALLDAADTIWSLRNKLGDLQDEREELREENAKLRELVKDMRKHGLCKCKYEDDCQACEFAFPLRMQELGLEWWDFDD